MFTIAPMEKKDITEAVKIWGAQFYRYCHCDDFPDFFSGGKETIEQYLLQRIDEGNAIAATKEGSLAGYMAWMYFDFHKERTAFLPIVGNAASSTTTRYLLRGIKTVQ